MIELEILLADLREFSPDVLAQQTLSPSSAKRLAEISSTARRQQFLLGRWLMAHAAGRSMTGIEEGRSGFPLFSGSPDLHASISHSGHHLAVIVSCGFRCGLDIESPARERDWLALAQRAFHPAEVAWLNAAPASLSLRFHQVWTLREAIFKAGLRPQVVAGSAVLDTENGQTTDGIFWQFITQPGLFISAVAAQPFNVRLRTVSSQSEPRYPL